MKAILDHVGIAVRDVEAALAFYRDALTMNAVAAFGGLPQVTVPVVNEPDRPLALSFIGPRGSDRALIARVRQLFPTVA